MGRFNQSSTNGVKITNIVGNNYVADNSAGFKSEIKSLWEAYATEGVNLTKDFGGILTSASEKGTFIENVLESLTTSPIFTNSEAIKSPFYNNYADRIDQLLENSMNKIAQESAMTGYAPIVAYSPFFIKKQWIEAVFKDVLMTEVPDSAVINLAFEKRFVTTIEDDGKKTEYPLPESLYDDDIMRKLHKNATGIDIVEDPQTLPMKNVYLIDSAYFPGIGYGDPKVELTHGLHIAAVVLKMDRSVNAELADTTKFPSEEFTVPVNIKIDIATYNFIGGDVKYDIKDPTTGTVIYTLKDRIIGNVDFVNNTITAMATDGVAIQIILRGKTANRFNERSIDIIRRVQSLQYTMPESGPRMNAAITVEDAADALVLQNVDVIADNIDMMGKTLANFEDAEIKMFLDDSYEAQANGASSLFGPFDGSGSMIVSGGFDALPYETYNGRISDWMKDSREYFERVIAGMKIKLNSPDCIVVCVAHPNLIRFLQDGINWVFSDDTQISGMKIAYNFGVYTTAQDRVHILTSLRMNQDYGLKFVLIPLTGELITFKHYKYNTIIDRNYRNPLHTLVPNIMCTHRTLTFEVLPVQGKMTISGRDLFSPNSLKRVAP